MSQAHADVPFDPYTAEPTFFDKHREAVWAAGVWVATVVLTVICFPPFHAAELAYAFATPAIYWAYLSPRFRLYAWTVFAAQAVAWTWLLGWLHPVTWGGLFLLGPVVGAWTGVWYLAVWWVMPRMIGRPTLTRLAAMLGLAAAWVVIEWTRTWFLSGFPWLPLAASQWKMVSMLQVAAYTGAGGISFVIVAVNIGFAAYAHRLFREGAKGLNKRSQEFFLALFLVLACFSVHVQTAFNRGRFTEPLARVAFVQPYIPQSVKWDGSKAGEILDTIREVTERAAKLKPDVILWPEAVTPYAVKGSAQMQRWTEELAARAGAPLLLGSIVIEGLGTPGEAWFNGAVVVSPEAGLEAQAYAKRHLVPFGEYVPLRPVLGWLNKLVPVGDSDFQAGAGAAPLVVRTAGGSCSFGPLICYEDVFPKLARESALAGADVLAVLTNDAWYGEGAAAYQHAAHSVLRAVETRRPVLRCGNGGWSGWIDEFGNVRAEVKRLPGGAVTTRPRGERDEPGFAEATVYFRGCAAAEVSRDRRFIGVQSFYTEHGDWFVLLCAGLAAFGGFALKSARSAAAAATVAPAEE